MPKINDLILKADCFPDAAFIKVGIARLIKRKNVIENSDYLLSIIINTEINIDNNSFSEFPNFVLQHCDQINIRRKPGYKFPERATILSEVHFPGHFSFVKKM